MMEGVRILLSTAWSAWAASVIALTVLGLAIVLYRRAFRSLSGARATCLIALRSLALLVFLLFLFRPVLSYRRGGEKGASVVLLLDNSKSMALKDGFGGKNRLETAKDLLLPHGGDLVREVKTRFPVEIYRFSETAEPIRGKEIGGLQPAGEWTDLASSLRRILGLRGASRPLAILVFSDGACNAGDDAASVFATEGIPALTVGLGSELAKKPGFRDLSVANVAAGEVASVNITEEITVWIKGLGFDPKPGEKITVCLRRGTEELCQATAPLPRGGETARVTLSYTPREVGFFEYEVVVPRVAGEAIAENNRWRFCQEVRGGRLRALYIEGSLRWEYKFLKRTLESDPNVNLTCLVRTAEDRFYLQGAKGKELVKGIDFSTKGLRGYDAIILGDLEYEALGEERLEALEKYVSERGGGLIVLGGRRSFGSGGYGGTRLEALLPVRLGEARGDFDGTLHMVLTDEGQAHPVFRGIGDFFSRRAASTGPVPLKLGGCNRVSGKKPAATVLAVGSGPGVESGLILLAVQRYGSGKVLAFTGDTTWKWYLGLKGMGRDSPYERFWRQSLRWLSGREAIDRGRTPLKLWSEKRNYAPGERVKILARVEKEIGRPIRLAASLEDPGGGCCAIRFDHRPGRRGDDEAVVSPAAPGRYRVRGEVTGPRGKRASDAFSFFVGGGNREFTRPGWNPDLLKSVARESGGRYFTVLDAEDIPSELQRLRSGDEDLARIEVWNSPVFFLLFLGLITVEWVLRKRWALM
jgi:uncharacterized membrane protein